MSEQIPVETASKASAAELLQQGPNDLAHLLKIRELVFSDQSEHVNLEVWARDTAPGTLAAGFAWWVLGAHDKCLETMAGKESEAGVRAVKSLAMTASNQAEQAIREVGEPSTPDEGKARAVALAAALGAGTDHVDAIRKTLDQPGPLADSATIDFLQGLLHEKELEIDKAVESYLRCQDRDPYFRENSFRLARLLELKGHDEEALELYEDHCKKGPPNVSVLMNLGLLYEDLGEWRNAEYCYHQAIELDPTNERARLFLADAQASMVMHYDEDQERREDKRNAILRMPVTDFELSVRSRNCLAKMGIKTLGDLVLKTEAELLSYKNFGETSLLEIQEILSSKSLRLGMHPDELTAESFGKDAQQEFDPEDPRARPITTLELSVRSRRVIEQFRLRTVSDLCEKTEAELMACPNFGQTSLNEIKSKLDELGLALKG